MQQITVLREGLLCHFYSGEKLETFLGTRRKIDCAGKEKCDLYIKYGFKNCNLILDTVKKAGE